MLLKSIRKSFNITNRNIILATPLILFSLLSSIYILFSIKGNSISLLISFVLLMLMLAAFIAGWGYMIKNCIIEPDREDMISSAKEFPTGVGDFFVPAIGAVLVRIAFSLIILYATLQIGMHFIGDIGISSAKILEALKSDAAAMALVNSLSQEQLLKYMSWELLLLFASGIDWLLAMFYLPVLFFKQRNPFLAFVISIKDLFARKFFSNILLYAFFVVTVVILSLLNVLFGANTFMHFIYTLINFYYLVFITILVFHYYYVNYVEIGGEIDQTIED